MTLFLLTFFFLYSLLHLYAFLRAKTALAFGAGASIFLIFFMLIMIAAPVIVRTSERHNLESLARLMSYIGYTWLGLLFLFCSASIAVDFWRFLAFGASAVFRTDMSAITLSRKVSFYIPLLFSLLAASYGYFEAKDIRTERFIIETKKLPEEIKKLRIVQISDVHLGLIVRQDRLRNILREVKKTNPDILVSTGDLVDGQINGLKGLADLLEEIKPRYGKFAVTGNHEFFADIDQATAFIQKAGFNLLRGKAVEVEGLINIVGVDDPTGKAFGLSRDVSEKKLLLVSENNRFTLFLKHRPIVEKGSVGLFDLQLSGHTHKGQIFPFSIFTWLYYPVHTGLFDLKNNHYLYVSRGAGTWGPPIRFLSHPEVTIIDLVRK